MTKDIRDIFYNLTLPSRKWQHYLDIYNKILPRYIGNKPTILEIGVANGGSMELWHKYFENATLYGIDAAEKTKSLNFDFPIQIAIGDQANPNFWEYFFKTNPNIEFDIIIDDGGHEMNQQLVSLQYLFPKLKKNGLYIIEDTHTSYWPEWGGGFRSQHTFIENVKGLIDLLHLSYIKTTTPNPELSKIFKDLTNISFYNSIVVLEKEELSPPIEADSMKKEQHNTQSSMKIWNSLLKST
jgi:hypothetical protein